MINNAPECRSLTADAMQTSHERLVQRVSARAPDPSTATSPELSVKVPQLVDVDSCSCNYRWDRTADHLRGDSRVGWVKNESWSTRLGSRQPTSHRSGHAYRCHANVCCAYSPSQYPPTTFRTETAVHGIDVSTAGILKHSNRSRLKVEESWRCVRSASCAEGLHRTCPTPRAKSRVPP